MHLSDDLHCFHLIYVICSCLPGNQTHDLGVASTCSTVWASGRQSQDFRPCFNSVMMIRSMLYLAETCDAIVFEIWRVFELRCGRSPWPVEWKRSAATPASHGHVARPAWPVDVTITESWSTDVCAIKLQSCATGKLIHASQDRSCLMSFSSERLSLI